MRDTSPLLISPKHSLDPFLALRINELASPKSQPNDLSILGTNEIEKTLAMFSDNEKFSSVADQMRLKLSEIEKQKHEMLIELIGWKTKYIELEPKVDQLKNEISTLKAEKESSQKMKEELIDKIEKLSGLLLEAQNDRANLKGTIRELEARMNPLECFTLPDWPSRARSGFKKDLFDELLIAKKLIVEKNKEIADLKAKIKPERQGSKLRTKTGSMMLDFEKRQYELRMARNQASKSPILIHEGDKENICEMTSDSCRLKSPKTADEILKYQTDIANLKHSIEILLTENQRLVDALQKFDKIEKQKTSQTLSTSAHTTTASPDKKLKSKTLTVPASVSGKKTGSITSTAKVVRLDLNIVSDVAVKNLPAPLSRKNSAPKPEAILAESTKNFEKRRSSVAVRNNC